MAQSLGDHNSRGLKFTTKLHKESFSLGKTIKARALTSWGLVTCCGLRVLRALRDLGRWWFSWATAGARSYATLFFRTFSRRFLRRLLVRSLQQKRKMCSRVPTYIAPWAHVMPSTWRLPHWLPRSDVSPRELNQSHLTQAPEPRANPQGKR